MFECPKNLESFNAILFGTPNYHHTLTHNVKEFLEELAFRKVNLKGKIGAAFGSYGWSKESPNMILEILKNRFEMNIVEPALLIKYTPDEKGLEECKEFGKKIVQQILKTS
jgi:flavorubredoxin